MSLEDDARQLVRSEIIRTTSTIVVIDGIVSELARKYPACTIQQVTERVIQAVSSQGGAVAWEGEDGPHRLSGA